MSDQLHPSTLAACTTEIVAAFVASHTVANAELPQLIDLVARNLAMLSAASEPKVAKPKPAIPIKRSVQDDQLICLLCGRSAKMLKRHLDIAHRLTPDEYRTMFNLKLDYPMTAPNYAKLRSEMAKGFGFGRKMKVTKNAKPKSRHGK